MMTKSENNRWLAVTLFVAALIAMLFSTTPTWAIDYANLEYLIIVDPDFRAAADELALWKNEKGLITQVATTDETGTTTADIAAFIAAADAASGGTLEYLLLFGDSDVIPAYDYTPVQTQSDAPYSSDMPYVDFDGDLFPDLAYGRISATSEDEAQTAVDRILDYEKTPSFNTAYYDTYMFASYFSEETSAAHASPVSGGSYHLGEYISAVTAGASGNSITFQYANPATDTSTAGGYAANQSESISVVGTAITVTLGTDATGTIDTTAQQMTDLINADAAASALVSVVVYPYFGASDTTVQRAVSFSLSGGNDFDGVEDDAYASNAEDIYDIGATVHGKTIERLYEADQPWTSTNPDGPQYFNDGDAVPADLLYSSGYTWSVSAADIVSEFNSGRAIIMHRDHGQVAGWTHPLFYTNDATFNTITNGDTDSYDNYEDMLPVVFSINCQSGAWDGNDSFTEQLLMGGDGGAVAVISATALSFTYMNNYLSKGLFDTVWDDTTTDVSSAGASYRLGDMLNYALLYVAAQGYSSTDTSTSEFEVFGDPTLEVWTDEPELFDFSLSKAGNILIVNNDSTGIFPSDTSVTVFQNDALVATGTRLGVGKRYAADLSALARGTDFSLFVTAPGYRPYAITIPNPRMLIRNQANIETCYQNGGPYFADADGDGFGDASTRVCAATSGYIGNDDDCDDTDATSGPEQSEICGDSKDNNCSGWVDEGCDAVELTYTVTTDISSIDVGSGIAMTTTDIDGDGLIDVLLGDYTGTLSHYEQSASGVATFTKVTDNFNSIDVGSNPHPAATDFDGDGLIDLIIGASDGSVWYYEQDAAASASFSLVTNSFLGVNIGFKASPAIVDLNGDGLLDLFFGDQNNGLTYYVQSAVNATTFTEVSSGNVTSDYNYLMPQFNDLDGDGLMDLLMGTTDSYNILHYEQMSPTSTDFALVTTTFDSITSPISPASFGLADVGGDGSMDLLLGDVYGKVDYYCSCH